MTMPSARADDAIPVVDQDVARDDRRRREPVVLLNHRLHAVGGQHLERRLLGRASRAHACPCPETAARRIARSRRYSQMACVIAAMCGSVNVPSVDVPRCPLVPNDTR